MFNPATMQQIFSQRHFLLQYSRSMCMTLEWDMSTTSNATDVQMRGSQLYTALFFPLLEFFPTGFSLARFLMRQYSIVELWSEMMSSKGECCKWMEETPHKWTPSFPPPFHSLSQMSIYMIIMSTGKSNINTEDRCQLKTYHFLNSQLIKSLSLSSISFQVL